MACNLINSLVDLDDENTHRIWLEELKDAVNCAIETAESASSLLVYDNTLTSAAQTIDISDLDGTTAGGYHIECQFYNPTGSGEDYQMYINGDYTVGNYYSRYVHGSGAAPTTGTNNNANIARATASRETTFFVGDISITANANDGGYDYRGIGQENRKARNNLESVQWSLSYDSGTQISNLTDIRIASTNAGGIGVGSTIRIWRKV